MKICKDCGLEKPVSEFYTFGKYLSSYCKPCNNLRARKWEAANPEKVRTKNTKWRADNPEKERAWHAKYREANPEKERSRVAKWRAANSERIRVQVAKYHAANLSKVRAYNASWFASHPEKVREYNRNRRARKKGSGGTVTDADWAWLKQQYNHTCLGCDRKEPEIKLTLDHVVSLRNGGRHEIDNIQPLCISCNSRKSTRNDDYRDISAPREAAPMVTI